MAIPKKKRRIITVNQTEYYWRLESNGCLYIETGQSPNHIIKAYFDKGYFAVPQVVRAIIDYTIHHQIDTQPLVIIENAHDVFKAELENHQQKEQNKNDRKIFAWHKDLKEKGWDEYHSAKKCILEKDYFNAIFHFICSIRIDPSRKERWTLLENFITDDNKSAELLNERAYYYRELSTHVEDKSYCRKAAFKDIEEALKLNPDCAIVYGTLAELLYDENDVQGFYYNWEKALHKGMTQSISGWIKFDLKEEAEFKRISKKYLE
jgi:tetratricopeptide (TPR) repeat protein